MIIKCNGTKNNVKIGFITQRDQETGISRISQHSLTLSSEEGTKLRN